MNRASMISMTRRGLLGATAAAILPFGGALAALRTPGQGSGPFYPRSKPLDRDNDLISVQGATGRPRGRVLHLAGRVLDATGKPLAGARVEIWQANAFGRYDHPGDRRDVPLDPNFQGYGEDRTDAGGAYGFRTILPAPYPASATWMRPPHIHFSVSGAGFQPLVTQMYFAGDPLNRADRLLNGIADPKARARLIVEIQPLASDRKAAQATFDIVVADG